MRLRPVLLGALSFAVILGFWQAIVELGIVDPFLVASPSRVASALWDQATAGLLWDNVRASFVELIIGLALATLVGLPLGLAIGWYRRVSLAIEPLVWLQYSAPINAL
jgi:NitT/TauT family transport system permease protein